MIQNGGMRKKLLRWLLAALVPAVACAQNAVTVRVDAGVRMGPYTPLWAYFGYDEPNYTYAPNGRKLVAELGALGAVPVHIRTHNLLTTGDGTPALKWGSTNAYTEDATGRPVYDWTIIDRIFDTYVTAKAKPFVEIGFMPEALSVKPEPYQHHWPKTRIAAGWAYPPKDYGKWAALVEAWVRHSIARYGQAEVESWYWELWNEPDIEYWQGTPEEYNKLYDYTADAVKRVAPHARVGGPATTGPAGAKAAAYLRQFLEHCARGKNAATGKAGSPLDFISFHAKGRPTLVDGHVRMGLANELRDVAAGFDIVAGFPEYRKLPIILSEADPEGCAACSAEGHPENAYRNGPLYACYTAAAISNLFKLADRRKANLEGMLTWAFEFEGQPYFAGFRTLATNGIDKPVLNVFRMAAMMSGECVKVESSGAVGLDEILESGVRAKPDIDALAARSDRSVTVMLWNYHDDDVPAPDADIHLTVAGLPANVHQMKLRHYRIDRDHSNAYTVWKAMGSQDYAHLEAAGKLELLTPESAVTSKSGTVELSFTLPRQAVSLIQLSFSGAR
jgi:xylan 1,4-beta-xylosidase